MHIYLWYIKNIYSYTPAQVSSIAGFSFHLLIYIHGGLLVSCLQESQKKEASQTQRRHERKKEKRKRSARPQVQEQSLNQSQAQAGTLTLMDDPNMHPQLVELPQTEKPQKTTVKTVPKTPKARPA